MFGVSFTGTPICGNGGKPEVELCARWYALGAFYPLSRHRPAAGEPTRDPASLGPVVVAAARYALKQRYTLLPTLYSAMINARISGEPAVRSMFMNFPNDPECTSMTTQFMWSNQLLVLPVLQPNQSTVNAYLPAGRWFSFPDMREVSFDRRAKGRWEQFAAPLDHIPLLVSGGSVIFTQPPKKTVEQTYDETLTLHLFLSDSGEAQNVFIFDDGKSNFIGQRLNTQMAYFAREVSSSSLLLLSP
jgi:alpha-glucosidase (family GH31 glycosyl hydrolase)